MVFGTNVIDVPRPFVAKLKSKENALQNTKHGKGNMAENKYNIGK